MEQHFDTDDDEFVDERLTQIVSYLDGELDETQMNAFEQDLINDPEMRSHADILSRTWGLLDSLEEVSASRQFTQETMATISAEVVEESVRSSDRFRQVAVALARYRIVPSFLLGLIAASIGLFVGHQMQETRSEIGDAAVTKTALQNLDLLERLELYDLVPNADQLKSLKLAAPAAASENSADEDAP